MTDLQFPDVLKWAIPFFLIMIALELLWLWRRPIKNAYRFKDAMTSLAMGSGMTLFDIAFGFISVAILFFFWEFRFFDLGISAWVFVLALIADDFLYYWRHYFYHKSRWFWANHIVHHSSEHYNLTTALRQPWTGNFSGSVLLNVPLVLLGVHPLLLAFVGGINLLYQFWIHTETVRKMPLWFEYIFNTPSHHRVHHGRNARYLDANFAGIFIIWDRMFGTFVPEKDDEKPEYGIMVPLKSFNPIVVAFHEYLAMVKDALQPGITLRQRLAYIFMPPGTSHDGSKQTVRQIKQAYIKQHPHEQTAPGFRAYLRPSQSR